eukprot:CAMPEP_0195155006 /NCGR_PEP_ID=MMETSP0448-20130528/183938_1 /TAXON_ID=66468 /ORGANISM="Heterocapsa triquestra, Strain CCMP 448" /LENGTH=1096 /DNA_ID=CAMNT_0040193787 /DNA_START=67 /DNA_END=3355 /DNA_ORIENTATION=+
MQQRSVMAILALCVQLLVGAAGESFYHPRLRSQHLSSHGVRGSLGALTVGGAEDKETGDLSLIATDRQMESNSTAIVESHFPTIQSLETTIATLEADRKAGKATPGMDKFVTTVTNMIKNEMIPEMMKQHRMAKKQLYRFEIGFLACGKIRSVSRARIASLSVVRTSSRSQHRSCRKFESAKATSKLACQKIVAEKKATMRAACKAFKDLHRNPANEADNCHTGPSEEPYHDWLTRNKKYFEKHRDTFRDAKAACQAATRAYWQAERPCSRKTSLWLRTRRTCVKKQHALETATCTQAKKVKDTCATYETCYDAQKAMYLKQKPRIMVQEKDRKGEYRALMRIECLLTGVFAKPDKVDTKAIDTCKNKTHTTEHLNLKYPAIPDKMDCQKSPPIPGEKMFAKIEFAKMPKHTRAARQDECILSPGGGVIMGLAKGARKDKCRMDNGWLQAQNGGSCLVSGIDGIPVQVDFSGQDGLPEVPADPRREDVRQDRVRQDAEAHPGREEDECILSPGGGVIMGLAKGARKDKCRMDNGWLQAQNGGSCLISGIDGIPVQVDFTKRRYTKYRFTMKMDEANTRNGQSEGGGFEICNLVGLSSFASDKGPVIAFDDTKVPSRWGYHLKGGFATKVHRSGRVATCKDLLVNYKVWGRTGKGIDVSKYTGGRMKWIGCMGDGCSANTFYCNDQSDGITFGSQGTLRGLLGNTVPNRHYGCCSRRHPSSVCNAMDKTKDITALCRNLGYTRGTILESRKSNWCPEVEFSKGKWGSDFVNSHGYGHKFRCQGAQAKALYTNKKYYKAAEPKAGVPKQWDLTMEYRGGKYMLRSLKIEGTDFSGYKGSVTKCVARKKSYGLAPRIQAARTGKVYIRDFRVFQGNSLRKPMKQTVGQGVGLHAEQQKRRIMRAALSAVRNMATCSRNGAKPNNAWRMQRMVVQKRGTVFRKNPRLARNLRRRWNAYAMLRNVVSYKFRIIQRRYQHLRVGLSGYKNAHLHYPGGVAVGVYPGGRLLFEGCCWRRWRVNDVIAMRIQQGRYCVYHNNRRVFCHRSRRPPRSGKANMGIWIHEADSEGVQMESVCTNAAEETREAWGGSREKHRAAGLSP